MVQQPPVLLRVIVVSAAIAAVLGFSLPRAAAQDAPVPLEVIAKNLAENVLGEGVVKRVQVARAGRYIEIDWEAALYRTTNTASKNREQLRGEALLATGSIMGVLRPELIVFRIWFGPKNIATGRRHNDGRFLITYAKELGG